MKCYCPTYKLCLIADISRHFEQPAKQSRTVHFKGKPGSNVVRCMHGRGPGGSSLGTSDETILFIVKM